MSIRREGRGGAVALVIAMAAMLSGCDYWPPALQTQIEQLRSELQTVTMEKTQLQTQMTALAKAKDDLQAQVDDLVRTNRDKSAMIASLQSSVTSLQERLTKSSKPTTARVASSKPATVKPGTKPALKAASKTPVKKKTLTKSATAH
jgi:septal ring factor EnvC (AmiA/AmiB activator)